MIKIKDKNPTIFAELEKIVPDNILFQVIGTGKEIDDLYTYMFGERFTDDNLDSTKTAQYIKTIYLDKWVHAYETINNANTILPDLGSKDTKTVTHKYKYTDTINDRDDVPIFDSTETGLNNEYNRTLIHDETDTNGINEKTEVSTKSSIYNFNVSYEYLLKNWINDIVFTDVNTMITMLIHN